MAYALESDLLTGGIPFPAYISKAQAIQNASDEVDSYLAGRYVTPVVLPEVSSTPGAIDSMRQVRLVLKRLTAQVASGRVILAAAAGAEDSEVHAYGRYLLNQALKVLQQIADGDILLPGVPANPDLPSVSEASMPLVVNGDPYSQVDAFYDNATNGSNSFFNRRLF